MKLGCIEKCLQIFDVLSQNSQGLRLSEISSTLDLPISSVHHILSTLSPHGYVMQDPENKKYSIGFRFLEVGHRILDNFDIRSVARTHLRKLQEACGETVHLAILRNQKVIYIDKIGSHTGLSLVTYVGFATDPHAAAGGKVLLSELSASEVRRLYPSGVLPKYGPKTISTVEALLQELKRVRKLGYAIDDEEYYEGVRCISAPIRAGEHIVASLSITGAIFSMTMNKIMNEYKAMVIESAQVISIELPY